MSDLEYEALAFESRDATLADIATGDTGRAARAMLACALESDDRDLIETLAVALSVAEDPVIRRAAVHALGHVARRFGAVNTQAVQGVVARLSGDPLLDGAVEDLREDLDVFLAPKA